MIHSDWPEVERVIYFSGGIAGIVKSQDDKLELYPYLHSEPKIYEKLNNYSSFTEIATKYKLIIVGIDYYKDSNQIMGISPPEWVPFTYEDSRQYHKIIDKMSGLRNCAFNKNNFEFIYQIRKIEEWTKASSRALKGISTSYNRTLAGRILINDFTNNSCFDDANCDFIYDSLHNFLYYTSTLLDHITEFIVKFISTSINTKFKKIRKLAKLKEWFDKHDKDVLPTEISDKIMDGYNLDNHSKIIPGWLEYLKKYRNAITHDRPIHMINYKIYACLSTINAYGNTIPQLYFPLPDLPLLEENLYDYNFLKEKIIGPRLDNYTRKSHDGLEICCRIYWELLNFLEFILNFSPIEPQILKITSSNATNFKIKFS